MLPVTKPWFVRSTPRSSELNNSCDEDYDSWETITKTHLHHHSSGSGVLGVLVQLAVDLTAHDGHPGECCQEEELVEMAQ